jgi:hypothetical protein
MRRLLIFPFAAVVSFGQAQNPSSTQPTPKPNNSGVKPHVIVVPKSPEQEQAEKWAIVNGVVNRYTRTRSWLDGLRAKYPSKVGNDAGEDEAHVLGRHYAEVEESFEKSAIPIGDDLVDDFEDYQDSVPSTSTLALNTMFANAEHLDLILDGLQAEERKWLRTHAKERVEPSPVIVVGK